MSEWIKLSEKKPKICQWCLVYDNHSEFNEKKFHVGQYQGSVYFEVGHCPGDYYGERDCKTEFWMPLPKPPEDL